MKMFRGLIIAGALLVTTGWVAAGPVGVGDNDRVVFFGDKTVSYPGYGVFIENFVRVKYPESKARYWHVGSRGYDRLAKAHEMFEELVAPIKPTVVVLSWGLGEGQMRPPSDDRASRVEAEFKKLIEKCQKVGAKVFVVTPPAPNIAKKSILKVNRYDESVQQISTSMASAAKAAGAAVIDWNSATRQMKADKPDVPLVDKDGLLPTAMSRSIVAKLIMDAWKLEPLNVSVEVDWAAKRGKSNAGEVNVMEVSDRVVHVELKDFPLPLFTGRRGDAYSDAMACSRYCQLKLKVNNLPGGPVAMVEPGSKHRPMMVPADRLKSGFNLASRSPLTAGAQFKEFTDLIQGKNFRYSETVRWVDRNMKEKPPEPELQESYETYLLSQQQYHDGLVKVIERTPRTIDMIIELSLLPGGK